jgi:hypothetical protein
MKKILFLLLSLTLISGVALSTDIKGIVKDIEQERLPGVSVKILAARDSVTRGLTVTNSNGAFSLKDVTPGDYTLMLSMIGMDTRSFDIKAEEGDSIIDMGVITLSEEAVNLKEAVVTAVKSAVVVKQDTIEFNADSFKTKPNATVEDLLKKLPGVEVSSDGSITSNGKSVSKILVDGKEFFSDDPTMASKNLTSDIVDKVQVVDRKSDLARLTGVDDGEEETVINLTVKKNMKNGWFGTLKGGYGTDNRYEGSFNISTFTNNQQISIVGGGNNINEMGFSDSGRGRFRDFGQNGGITTAQRLGLNFNLGKTEKFRVGGNIFYTHSDRYAETYTETQYLFPDSVSKMKQGSNSRDRGHNLRANLRMEWKIDSLNTLDFRPGFTFNNRTSEMTDTSMLYAGDIAETRVNSNDSRRFNHGTSWNFDGNLIYNHNFRSRKGRSLSVQGRYSFSNTTQRTTSWNDIQYYLQQEDSEQLYRYLDDHQWNNSVEGRITWTEPLGNVSRGNFLQVAYRVKYNFNNADKDTYNLPNPEGLENVIDYNTLPEDGVFSTTLSNRFRNTFSTHELQVGYKKVNSKYNLETGLTFAPSSSKSTDLIDATRNIETRWVWNVAPFARFRYKFSKTMSLSADYRARSASPSISQLQPVADVSDPLHITEGNPDLKPSFTQNVNLRFNNYNQDTQQSIFASVFGQYTQNVTVARTVTDPETGIQHTTYSNANGNASAMGMFMLNQPIQNTHFRINARMAGNFSSNAGYINGDFNRTGNLRVSPTVGVTYSMDLLQVTLNPTYTFGMTTNTLPQQKNQYTHKYGFATNVELYLPFGLNISTDLSFDKSTGYAAAFNEETWMWNAELSYSCLSDKSLTFSVRAYDLLGMNKNIERSVSANTIMDKRYNDLTRYVMIGVAWKFNTMKKRKSSAMEPGMDGMPEPPGDGERPMGPPPGGGGGPGGGGPM